MMNGNYGGGWMGGGGWMMIVGVLVCIAIIGTVVWLVMRSLKNKQAPPLSSLPHQSPSQMEQGYQPPPQQSTETYQEGEKQYSYPSQPVQYPQPQERPLN